MKNRFLDSNLFFLFCSISCRCSHPTLSLLQKRDCVANNFWIQQRTVIDNISEEEKKVKGKYGMKIEDIYSTTNDLLNYTKFILLSIWLLANGPENRCTASRRYSLSIFHASLIGVIHTKNFLSSSCNHPLILAMLYCLCNQLENESFKLDKLFTKFVHRHFTIPFPHVS